MDTFTREQRSENMRRIRSADTQAELTVRSLLHKAGFRFRLHDKRLPGKPDIVLRRYRTAIFVHGCFWHGHQNCKAGHRPKSNTEYWNKKLDRNLNRDAANAQVLRNLRWHRIVVWECELKDRDSLQRRLLSELSNDQP